MSAHDPLNARPSLFECVRQGISARGEGRLDKELDARAALAAIEAKVERLSEVHRRLILAVTPGSGSFLNATGPNATHEDGEAYSALFSAWHAATRELRAVVEE